MGDGRRRESRRRRSEREANATFDDADDVENVEVPAGETEIGSSSCLLSARGGDGVVL